MGKNQKEVVDQPEQPIEQQTPIEKQIEEREKPEPSKSVNATKVNFNFSNDTLANEEDMSQVRDILASGEQQGEELLLQDQMFVSAEEVARFLEGTYDVQGWFTYPEMWKRPKDFYLEIAEGILPHINAWAMRIPAVGHAIKTVSAAGSWGRLIWDLAGTWILVYKRKQLEAEKKKEEEENGGTKVDYSQQPTHIKPAGPHFIP